MPDSFAASTNNSSFTGKMQGELGGAFSVPTVRIGLRPGLFDAFHRSGPVTSAGADNTNLVGGLYYNASTMICVTTSLDQ
ncbi:hypothetical protein [Agrobacterium tumefaciens]|uniref:hypothetical protein n=1 Tax=Agrobacterium tumefaciens TaxID=358 RepID=UPI003BB8857A